MAVYCNSLPEDALAPPAYLVDQERRQEVAESLGRRVWEVELQVTYLLQSKVKTQAEDREGRSMHQGNWFCWWSKKHKAARERR